MTLVNNKHKMFKGDDYMSSFYGVLHIYCLHVTLSRYSSFTAWHTLVIENVHYFK